MPKDLTELMGNVGQALYVGLVMLEDNFEPNDDVIFIDTAYDENILFNDDMIE